MLLTILIFILVLSVLVFVHELGHFWTARRFGLKPREFGFGFPPRAIGFYKDKAGIWKKVNGSKHVEDASDTIYSINWIPIGGFVDVGEDDLNQTGPGSFAGKKIWQRATILSSGVAMNVLLAAVLLSIGFMFGMPRVVNEGPDNAKVLKRYIQITEVIPSTPADKAGVKAKDVIVSIDGNKFETYEKLQEYLVSKKGKELDYKILRNGEEVGMKIVPEEMDGGVEGEKVVGIGVAIVVAEIVKYPWYMAIWYGFKTAVILVWMIILAFYDFIKGIFVGAGVSADVAGPVGIAKLTGEATRMGFIYLLQFTALLSLNLAVINFLPIPALDGGRVLFLIIEKLIGRPVKREVEAVLHYIFFILLMILVLVVTFRDLSNVEVIKNLINKIRS